MIGRHAETRGGPFIEVKGNGSVIILYATVNSVHYHCVVIKGSNETRLWSSDSAKEDGKDIFDVDLSIALDKSEEIRKRYAEPELTSLCQHVRNRLLDPRSGYSYLEKKQDIEFIERLARYKYNITEPSVFVDNILAHLQSKVLPPQKTLFGFPVEDPSNWIHITAWCIFPLSTFVLYRIGVYLANKIPKLRGIKGWGNFVLGGFITWGLFGCSGLANLPYDYEVLSVQTFVLIGVVGTETIIGIVYHFLTLSALKRRLQSSTRYF